MANFYLDDDEAHEDWDIERESFHREADAKDQQMDAPLPTRFYLDETWGLPVVRDRLHNSMIIGRFVTVSGAKHYLNLRELGVGHQLAMVENPEFDAAKREAS